MLRKKPLGGRKFQVTFTMPSIEGVSSLHLCGEFNDWSSTAAPMRREPDGSWVATLTLDGGKSYMFRYRDDRGEWHNDWGADAYVPNQFGSENSVLDLAAVQMAQTADTPSSRPKRMQPGTGKPAARGAQRSQQRKRRG